MIRKLSRKIFTGIILTALLVIYVLPMNVSAGSEVPEELKNLHAQSAVLMDADSGRVLYEKNGYEIRPMASTTKIMTCILALENGSEKMVVTASGAAAAQPKVHLGMTAGEEFYLEDLLYSLMLESHNDSAVAIAEAIGGSVENFAAMMNQKAREIGCLDTYFITPNGLDANDENGVHSTTAADLAKIMRYCLQTSPEKDRFLEITRTDQKSFADVSGGRSYSCYNHNAFLKMMDGALSGKTGFTGDAGYCYVGALRQDGKTFIVALLACGWPSHKGYKWEDTKALMNYGLSHYRYEEINRITETPDVSVKDGHLEGGGLYDQARIKTEIVPADIIEDWKVLLGNDENIQAKVDARTEFQAPLKKGQIVGRIVYTLNGETLHEEKIAVTEQAEQNTFSWKVQKLMEYWLIRQKQ